MNTGSYSRVLMMVSLLLALSGCKESGGSGPLTSNGGGTSNQSGGNPGGDTGGGDGPSGDPDGGYVDQNPGGSTGDGGVVATFKPALVLRASGCIMCHSRVESNIITDFGYGNSYFFGQNTPGLTARSGSIYGDHDINWSSSKVWGQVFVPNAATPFLPQTTLANYLRSRVVAPDAETPAPTIVEKDEIYIGAPTASRLLTIAGTFPAAHPQWKQMGMGAPEITGIELAPGGRFVQNTSGETVCSGDVIVNTTLFLNNLQLRTTNNGCRLYVVGPVFIQGPITYLGTATRRHLQITSTQAVVLGMGPGAVDGGPANTLRNRLVDFWTRGGYHTRDMSGSTQEKLDSIYTESTYIADLVDATAQLPHRRAVSFERLFLNAPNVQSRYQGEFKGVIVAEMAIASLNVFAFKFDPVFELVPILPLIPPGDFLRVE